MSYATASVELADDVQRLAIELGMSGFIRSKPRRLPHHLDQYVVLIGNRRHIELKAERGNIRTEPYQGYVYCLTVPSGAYLTRREGAMAISGNSQMQDAAADVMVQLLSEERTDQWGKMILGVGVKGMKANDVRKPPLTIMAYEFDDIGLTGIRKGRPGEFLTIENTSASMDVRGQVDSYLKAEGEASATTIARDTGLNRSVVSNLLRNGPYEPRRDGRAVLYSVKSGDPVVPQHVATQQVNGDGVVETPSYRQHQVDPTVISGSKEEIWTPEDQIDSMFEGGR